MMVTVDRLKELLCYEPKTGIWTWRVNRRRVHVGEVAGNFAGRYIQIRVDGKNHLCHRLAFLYMTGQAPPKYVDHIDMDTFNNKWSNLRPATNQQNMANRGPQSNNTSGYKGVYWEANARKWRAQIYNFKKINLGLFEDIEDAHLAYCEAAEKIFGEFARAA